MTDAYDDPNRIHYILGQQDGYRVGEMERIALATANSDLRSEVLLLRTRIADVAALVSHSDYASYSTDGPSWKTSAITNIRAIIEGL